LRVRRCRCGSAEECPTDRVHQLLIPGSVPGGRRVAGTRPEQCLRDDHLLAVERHRRTFVQAVPERYRLADPVAEGSVIRTGQHSVYGKAIGGIAHTPIISGGRCFSRLSTTRGCSAVWRAGPLPCWRPAPPELFRTGSPAWPGSARCWSRSPASPAQTRPCPARSRPRSRRYCPTTRPGGRSAGCRGATHSPRARRRPGRRPSAQPGG